MDALEAGSKATTEPRKRKRSSSSSTKDSASTPSSGEPAVVASGAAAAVTVKTETSVSGDATSPLPVKPMFKVNYCFCVLLKIIIIFFLSL